MSDESCGVKFWIAVIILDMLCSPGGVDRHLGVNPALQHGPGSGSVDYFRSAYCHLQNSNVRETFSFRKFSEHLHFLCDLRVMRAVCQCFILKLCFRPKYSVLGNVPGTELYLDIEMHREVKEKYGQP